MKHIPTSTPFSIFWKTFFKIEDRLREKKQAEMIMKKAIGTLLIVLGAGTFIWGSYIGQEADLGEERISQAEENIGQSRPTLGPVRRRAKQEMKTNAEEKIGEEKQTVGQIAINSTWLKGIAIVLFVIGLILIF